MYNNVGLITGYNEKIGNNTKGWSLSYNSQNLVDTIVEVSEFPSFSMSAGASAVDEGSAVSFTVTTERISDGTTLYWDTSSASDFATSTRTVARMAKE